MADHLIPDLPTGLTAGPTSPEDVGRVLELVVTAEQHYDGVAEIDSSDIEADFGRVGSTQRRTAY
jgi:hypothetical protein